MSPDTSTLAHLSAQARIGAYQRVRGERGDCSAIVC